MNLTISQPANARVTAFDQQRLVARGELLQVLDIAARYEAREAGANLTILLDATGEVLSRDSLLVTEAVVSSAAPPETPRRGPGRPRLGVVAREVTLLPEHWQWLADQPGGSSAALRRLIDEARAQEAERDRRRRAHSAAWKSLNVLGAGLVGVDGALMAIFTGDLPRFDQSSLGWPVDVRDYLRDIGFGGV